MKAKELREVIKQSIREGEDLQELLEELNLPEYEELEFLTFDEIVPFFTEEPEFPQGEGE